MVPKLHAKISDYWDQSTHAPSKTRGRGEKTRPSPAFALLGWSEDRAVWLRAILENFPEQSSQRDELLKLKAEFDALVPALPSSTGATGSQGGASARAAARTSGSPDFSLDDGKKPFDVTRLLDLSPVPLQELQARNGAGQSLKAVRASCCVPSFRNACCAGMPMRLAYVDAPAS